MNQDALLFGGVSSMIVNPVSKGATPMKLDLQNVITVTEADKGSGGKVVARHRAFPEIRAQGESPRKALLMLHSILRRSSDWAADDWHATDLAHAIIDLESSLRLLDCSDDAIIYGGRGCSLVKSGDLIHYSSGIPVVPANPDDDRPVFVEPRCDAASTDSVLVYSLGRRRAMRRQAGDGEAPGPGRTERRGSDRRQSDRRQHNRMSLISDVMRTLDELGGLGMGGANRLSS